MKKKAVIRYQTLTGEIIDVCYECFKLLVEERNDKPKRKEKKNKMNYDNNNKISIFKNDKKGNEKAPDYRGTTTLNNTFILFVR